MRTSTRLLEELKGKRVRIQKGLESHEGLLAGRADDFEDGPREWIVFWVDGSIHTEARFKANGGWSITQLEGD